MKKEEAEKHLNKLVFLKLRDGTKFNGTINSVSEDSLNFIDKFNQNVSIELRDISFIMEKGDNCER